MHPIRGFPGDGKAATFFFVHTQAVMTLPPEMFPF